jgi:hypothetical protein
MSSPISKVIDFIERYILDEDLIEEHIIKKMSYNLFLKKLKTQDKEKIDYNCHRTCVVNHDEIYYIIMEYIVTLTYQEDIFSNYICDGHSFAYMLHVWSREKLERGEDHGIYMFATNKFYKSYDDIITHFIYWFMRRSRNTHNLNDPCTKAAKSTYSKLVNIIKSFYVSEMSRRIAINKIKRNKIYNLGLGLKLSIKSFQQIM